MDVAYLKNEILEKNKIPDILESIGCHNIKFHSGTTDNYYTCANKDGDNPSAITVYCNSTLKCIDYTRELNSKKSTHDIIDLVMMNNNQNFFKALNFLCETCGIDYYDMENEEEKPESLKALDLLFSMLSNNENEYDEQGVKINQKPESVLDYYRPVVNDLFYDDGISYQTQADFEIGYDDERNMITIPIRDELGNLVGVKGRIPDKNVKHDKYTYIIRCPRGKILYNLHKAYPSIKQEGFVIIVESEKGVMQLYDMGFNNVIALGGSILTSAQEKKILSLNADIVFALDKDVKFEKVKAMADRFPYWVKKSAIIDTEDILDEKESPCDNVFKWDELWEKRVDL